MRQVPAQRLVFFKSQEVHYYALCWERSEKQVLSYIILLNYEKLNFDFLQCSTVLSNVCLFSGKCKDILIADFHLYWNFKSQVQRGIL